jgi:hypothetical protein
LLLGRPLSDPVDDLPTEEDLPEVLEILATDFASHGYDLHRLIRLIADTVAFRLDSAGVDGDDPSDAQELAWAAFPLTRLRPEQVAGFFQRLGGGDNAKLFSFYAYYTNRTQANLFVDARASILHRGAGWFAENP